MRLLTPIVLATLMAASPAAAGPGCQDGEKAVHHVFESADENQDGRLTRAEYGDAGLADFGLSFEQTDLDADGATTISEYLEIYRKHHPPTGASDV